MKNAELTLALVATALQLILLFSLIVHRHYKYFAAFFGCIVLSVATTVAIIAAMNHQLAYLWIYWVAEALYVALAFLALLEIFNSVFRNFYHLRWFRLLFPSVGILMVSLAVIRSLANPPAQVNRAFSAIIFLEIAIRFLQLGILLLFFALVRFFHTRWRQHEFGIALGFGISAAGLLVTFLLRSEFGTKFDYVVRIAPPIAYTLAVVVWLLTFLTPRPDRALQDPVSGITPEVMLAEVRRYRSTVKKILKR